MALNLISRHDLLTVSENLSTESQSTFEQSGQEAPENTFSNPL